MQANRVATSSTYVLLLGGSTNTPLPHQCRWSLFATLKSMSGTRAAAAAMAESRTTRHFVAFCSNFSKIAQSWQAHRRRTLERSYYISLNNVGCADDGQ